MKKALIFGALGQDGLFLTEFLSGLGYEVFGTTSRNLSHIEIANLENEHLVELQCLNLSHQEKVLRVISSVMPDEIYNLAGLSSVANSFNSTASYFDVNTNGVLSILEAIRVLSPKKEIRLFQSSSSEIFGDTEKSPQDENSSFRPYSPYGVSKLSAHLLSNLFRENYGIFVSCGIMFNHESEHRSLEFVTRKITDGISKIKLGISDKLMLGNLDDSRDWGFAGDYVRAMWAMLQRDLPDDYVIATGKSTSVSQFVEMCLETVGLSNDIEKYVKVSEEFLRKKRKIALVGNASKASAQLEWAPSLTIHQLARRMMRVDLIRNAKAHKLDLKRIPNIEWIGSDL